MKDIPGFEILSNKASSRIIDIKIKKLAGLVSLLTVLLNNINKTKRPIDIPKGSAGRNIEKFMEFSI